MHPPGSTGSRPAVEQKGRQREGLARWWCDSAQPQKANGTVAPAWSSLCREAHWPSALEAGCDPTMLEAAFWTVRFPSLLTPSRWVRDSPPAGPKQPVALFLHSLKDSRAAVLSHARFPNITTANMSPSYTMSSHLCKQIASSWRQTRHGSPDPTSPTLQPAAAYFPSPSPSPSREKRSMDSDRSDSPIMTRSSSVTSWRSAGK
ncbi:uncharacterized protein VDAG_01503 [Verticillium dahliae VdLs.17]|uniref:Uncharacterized protein n=2 Tax=Verticillium dahliae TaxID=27337 RepID=G2WUN0_VERDV|nr:uncharacterized protein VDAG_01503 [Verticillium dahliae VdLs.17]EGY17821.1 hypothetical protein VDAG_01503 [Verticillium dahliae VdLs.17]